MSWKLDENVQTSAGMVAAGRLGSGPALVLAHGWPWSSFSWHRIIPDLASRYRVHWYDMPGYGRSDKSAEQRTSLDVQGIIFAEMLSRWGLARPMVVAHDMGGATTLRAHLLHGCEFDWYVLMNVVAMRPWGSEFFNHVGRHVDAFLGLPPHIHRAVVEAYIKGAIVNEIDSRDFEKLVEPWLSGRRATKLLPAIRASRRKVHRRSRTDVRRYSLSGKDHLGRGRSMDSAGARQSASCADPTGIVRDTAWRRPSAAARSSGTGAGAAERIFITRSRRLRKGSNLGMDDTFSLAHFNIRLGLI